MPDDKQLQKVVRRPAPVAPPQYDVDAQISTAKKFPRDVALAGRKAAEAILADPDTAITCFYAIPRGKGWIEGPSVRLAEIVIGCWGNFRAAARQVGEDGTFVYAEGVAWDLESNLIISMETRRRIRTGAGQKYSTDMIAVTANAAAGVALRNAVLRVVPRAFWWPLYEKARNAAREEKNGEGNVLPFVERRGRMLAFLASVKSGPDREAVLRVLDRASIEEMTEDDLVKLRGIATAVSHGEASMRSIFGTGPAEFAGEPEPDAALDSLFTEDGKEAPASES